MVTYSRWALVGPSGKTRKSCLAANRKAALAILGRDGVVPEGWQLIRRDEVDAGEIHERVEGQDLAVTLQAIRIEKGAEQAFVTLARALGYQVKKVS